MPLHAVARPAGCNPILRAMISTVSDWNDMVDYERSGLSLLTNFTIAADIAVTAKDVLSLFEINRPPLRFFMGHAAIICFQTGKRNRDSRGDERDDLTSTKG